MPLKKYNTASSVLVKSSSSYNPAQIRENNPANPPNGSSSSSPKSGSSSCSSPPENTESNGFVANTNTSSITDQMTSLSKLMPSIIEAAAASVNAKQAQLIINNNETDFSSAKEGVLPDEIKLRLHVIFNQIEREFDALYAENVRLQQELIKNNSKPTDYSITTPNSFNATSSTSTLVASYQRSPSKTTLEKSYSNPANSIVSNNSIVPHIIQNKLLDKQQSLTGSAANSKSSGFSKTRINNLSFPKFRPNAREFIMQSIKNTSAQIVNKTQNNNSVHSSKLQYSLAGHKDGIWDINCTPIPNHLLNSHNNNVASYTNNNNLLIGTASADTTARLWYLNSHSSSSANQFSTNQFSPPSSATSGQQGNIQTNGFCIQQYCGHAGSVNSIRFHPRFFTDATNLILTASGDCQAHVWQCVLSPVNDSLESTSEVVLNYNNCYSFAISQSSDQSNYVGVSQSGLASPQQSNYHQYTSTATNLQSCNNNYQELIANTPIIRSPIKRFEGHTDVCIAADWFPDGELLATASWDRSANVYNVETGKVLCTLQHDDMLTNVNIHSTQKMILTSSKDTTFKVWDFRDPICSVNVYQGHNRSVNSAIFVNEDKIATSSDDQTVKLWDLRIMRSPVSTINMNSGVNRICTINANPDHQTSETYLCLPLDNRDIKIYNLHGDRVLRMPRSNRIGHTRLVTSLASYNNLLLSSSFDKVINCWSLDHNPAKSSNSLKFNFSNKENNLNLHQDQNHTPISQNGLIPNDHVLLGSSTSHNSKYETSPTQLNYNRSSCLSPTPVLQSLNNGNNNNVPSTSSSSQKGVNSLSKLAERIKI